MQTLTHPAIKTSLITRGDNQYTLSVHPLLPGFGYTFGNSIRRLLLTSIPGFAVTKIRINDLTHEYQTVEGVKEDALDILLNIKSLRTKINTDAETATIVLETKKGGNITGASFETNSEVSILNPDTYICNVSEGTKLRIEIEVSRGYGYTSYEKRDLRGNTEPTALLIDALFTPVKNVSLQVTQTRVGDQTNFDKLDIEFDTDGTVSGAEVAEYALSLMVSISQNIHSSLGASEDVKKVEKTSGKVKESSGDEDTLELSPKITNILKKNGIHTNTDLKARLDEIQDMPGLGDKAMDQIKEYLSTL